MLCEMRLSETWLGNYRSPSADKTAEGVRRRYLRALKSNISVNDSA